MLKIITRAAWVFILLTIGLGIATLVGNTSLTAYLLPCLAIMLALSTARIVMARKNERESHAG